MAKKGDNGGAGRPRPDRVQNGAPGPSAPPSGNGGQGGQAFPSSSSSSSGGAYAYAVDINFETKSFLKDEAATKAQPARSGTTGIAIKVVANYVHLTKTPGKVYEYEITYGGVKKQPKQGASGPSDSKGNAGIPDVSRMSLKDGKGGKGDIREIFKRTEKERIFQSGDLAALRASKGWATDYQKIWTLAPIPANDLHQKNLQYKMPNGRTETLLSIDFKLIRTMDFSNGAAALVDYKSGAQNHHPMELIDALNAIISRHVCKGSDNLLQLGLNKFFLKNTAVPLGPLQAIRGYFSSVRPGQKDVFLNINTIASPFYPEKPVSVFIKSIDVPQFRGDYGPPQKLLKNKAVWITYTIRHDGDDKDKSKQDFDPAHKDNLSRTIFGLGFPSNKQLIEVDGNKITVERHFKTKYNIRLQDPDLPAVNIGSGPDDDVKRQISAILKKGLQITPQNEPLNSRAAWVPPELMRLQPGQPFGRRLNGTQTTAMLNFAVKRPAQNQHLIKEEGLAQMQITHNDTSLGDLQIAIDDKLIEIPGRLLPVPQVQYRLRGKDHKPWHPTEANWWLDDRSAKGSLQLYRAGTAGLPFGFVIDFRTNKQDYDGTKVGNDIQSKIRARGLLAPSKKDANGKDLQDPDIPSVHSTFRDTRAALIAAKGHMTLCILPDKSVENYSRLKALADRGPGLQTICIAASTVGREIRNACLEGLVMKVNVKRQGQNHKVLHGNVLSDGQRCATTEVTTKSAFNRIEQNTMVMGADVIHPSGGAVMGCPSIAAVVANNDVNISNFPGSVRLQPGRQEFIDRENMISMAAECLRAWMLQHKKLPARIMYYRDGVSESQYGQVKGTEASAIRAAYDLVAGQPSKVLLTIIVCGKRHNTRFYAKEEKDTYKEKNANDGHPSHVNKNITYNGNLKPGLVVDRVITRPAVDETFDFFLQSHGALKGTARSCHYVVLENSGSKTLPALDVNQIQQLTHALCYNYAKATKGVSYACPAYYADRLCTRASLYLYDLLTGKYASNDLPMIGDDEKMDVFRVRMKNWVRGSDLWMLPHVRKIQGRENPWAPPLDGTMFYL